MSVLPVWARRSVVKELTGLTDEHIYRLISDGKVAFRKLGDAKQSATIYRVQDVLNWIEGLA